MVKEKRFQLALDEEIKAKLGELAEANTGENKSLMIRKLIMDAWESPERFGYHAPKEDALTLELA